MRNILAEFLVILVLLLANGVFAMIEIAVVSARKARLRKLADEGDSRARAALELAESPTRFLATVQVGITVVTVMAAAFGGATLSKALGRALQTVPSLAPYGDAIGLAVVGIGISYLSLIVGELVPKRLALNNPEGIARAWARPMTRFSALAGPLVRLIGFSTDIVLRLLRVKIQKPAPVTEDEIQLLLQEGVRAGVFHQAEPKMVERVLAMDRLPVRNIMTPRAKVVFLNKDDPHEAIWHKIVVSGHSDYPVYAGHRDNLIGIVSVKAIYANLAAGIPVHLADLAVPPFIVPSVQPVMRLLETFKQSGKHVALVADEFGSIAGLVTLIDMLEAITGDIPSQEDRLKPKAKRRPDGTWLVDALMEVEQFEALLPQLRFPRRESRTYDTLAGFVLKQLAHVPVEGEIFEWSGHRFEVIDMDRHRIDKMLIYPPGTPQPEQKRES